MCTLIFCRFCSRFRSMADSDKSGTQAESRYVIMPASSKAYCYGCGQSLRQSIALEVILWMPQLEDNPDLTKSIGTILDPEALRALDSMAQD